MLAIIPFLRVKHDLHFLIIAFFAKESAEDLAFADPKDRVFMKGVLITYVPVTGVADFAAEDEAYVTVIVHEESLYMSPPLKNIILLPDWQVNRQNHVGIRCPHFEPFNVGRYIRILTIARYGQYTRSTVSPQREQQ